MATQGQAPSHNARPDRQQIPSDPRYSLSDPVKLDMSWQAIDPLKAESSDRAGPRLAKESGGVVALPSTADSSFLTNAVDSAPSAWNANAGLFDDLLEINSYAWPATNDTGMPAIDFTAQEFQDPSDTQNFQAGLGLQTLPMNGEHYAYSEQAGMPYNGQIETGQDPASMAPFNADYGFNPYNDFQDHNFPHWENIPQLALMNTTPGFSALPGGSSLPQLPVTMQQSQTYAAPYDPMYTPAPYYQRTDQQYSNFIPSQNPQQYTGYVPLPDEESTALKQEPIAIDDHWSSHEQGNIDTGRNLKRKREPAVSKSKDDEHLIKRRRQINPSKTPSPSEADDSRRHSTASECSSLSKPVKPSVIRAGEKPKKVERKPWIRINNSTKGETTRTARINQFANEGPKYKIKDLPHGDWETSKFKFEYVDHDGFHEFKQRTMSARQVYEYITKFPGDNLRIWIQVVPSDTARRYASESHSHCRFEQCPNRQWTKKGTIEVGHYRVAFDEKHKVYGKGVIDPYDCVGFAHLYCMERFLDFEEICRVADVRVDKRTGMGKEPNGEASFIFTQKHKDEAAVANKFITAAQRGELDRTPEFHDYPNHADYKKGERKPHEQTLLYALYEMNIEYRCRSQIKQFLHRKVRPGMCLIHRGDMEVKLTQKKIEAELGWKNGRKSKVNKKDFDFSPYYDSFHPEIKERIAECVERREAYIAQDAAGIVPKNSKKRDIATGESSDDEDEKPIIELSKKRNIVSVEFSEDEDDIPVVKRSRKGRTTVYAESDDDIDKDNNQVKTVQRQRQQSQPSRSSPRKKERVNYTDSHDKLERYGYSRASEYYPAYQPAESYFQQQFVQPAQTQEHRIEPIQSQQQSVEQVQSTTSPARKPSSASFNNLFPAAQDGQAKFDFDDFDPDNFNLDDLPDRMIVPGYSDKYVEDLLNCEGLNRNWSSTNSPVSSPELSRGTRTADSPVSSPEISSRTRTAGFHKQPVTSSKEFEIDDPPNELNTSRLVRRKARRDLRRSKRLAKTVYKS